SQISGKNPDSDFVLNAEDAATQQRILPQHVVRPAKTRPLGWFDDETQADELFDLGLDIENSANGGSQARGRFRLRAKQAGKTQLGAVGKTIPMMIRLRSDSDRRTDIGDEAVGIWTIMLRDRPRIRPGAEEQLDESVVE